MALLLSVIYNKKSLTKGFFIFLLYTNVLDYNDSFLFS